MSFKISYLITFFLLIISKQLHANEVVDVFVSILPQQYFVERVGGPYVNVRVMVGPGQNPVTYEPTPKQMVSLASASLYYSIGVPFESTWLGQVKSNNPNLLVIDCCQHINLSGNQHHHHDHEHHDPHIWTSPIKVIDLVKKIESSLSSIDEANSDFYNKSALEFIDELTQLDTYIKDSTASLDNKTLIVSHPSWGFFSEQYGFQQISIEQNGKEIQGKAMSKLINYAKENNIKAIFTQPQFNNKGANIIASEVGGRTYQIDPLQKDYIKNMKTITKQIVSGLSSE